MTPALAAIRRTGASAPHALYAGPSGPRPPSSTYGSECRAEALDLLLGVVVVDRGAHHISQPARLHIQPGGLARGNRDVDILLGHLPLNGLRRDALHGEGDDAALHRPLIAQRNARQ